MGVLDQINVATHRFLSRRKEKLADNIFNSSNFLKYVRANLKEDFTGGRSIQENIIYDVTNGSFYAKGASFDISQKQLVEQIQFQPKFAYENLTFYKEDLQVFQREGPARIFSILDADTQIATEAFGAKLDIALFFNGQRAGYTNLFNGLAEAINDGSVTSWDGSAYTSYGGQTRGGKIGTSLNSAVVDVDGTLEYNQLEEQWGNACFSTEPTHIVTTVLGYSYLKEKFQAQQTYEAVTDLKTGVTGIKFNGGTIISDRYCPGSAIAGRVDPVVNSFMDGNFGAGTSYPSMTTTAGAAAESVWILTLKQPYFNFYVSADPEYAFGFTGFKPAQDNTVIAGQMLFGGNLTIPSPRVHRQLKRVSG